MHSKDENVPIDEVKTLGFSDQRMSQLFSRQVRANDDCRKEMVTTIRGDRATLRATQPGANVHEHPPTRLLHRELSSQIIGAFYEVYNTMVRGLLEGCYQNALYIELRERGLSVEREVPFDVQYKGKVVGEYRVDLLVGRKAIVECKTADTLNAHHESQMLHYLKATHTELGMLMYFGSKPLFRRFVHTKGSAVSSDAAVEETADGGVVTPTRRESAVQTASFLPASQC